MARRRRDERPSVWPKIFLFVFICILAGALAAWFGQGRVPGRIGLPASTSKPTPAASATPAAAEEPGREQMQREIDRLNETIKQKDRQIDDLTIQLKILTDGSRTDSKRKP